MIVRELSLVARPDSFAFITGNAQAIIASCSNEMDERSRVFVAGDSPSPSMSTTLPRPGSVRTTKVAYPHANPLPPSHAAFSLAWPHVPNLHSYAPADSDTGTRTRTLPIVPRSTRRVR